MLKHKPDLIIFDCDGVLVDSEPVSCAAFSAYLNSHDIPLSPDDIMARFVGWSLSSSKTALEADGWTLPDTFIDDVRDSNLKALAQGLDPIVGIAAALDNVQAMQIPMCVASSGQPIKISQSLRVTDLTDYFGDNVFSAQQVGRGKPDPALFLYAADQMGASPETTLVIEDSEVGVQAGIAANMTVFGFTGGAHTAANHAAKLQALGAQQTFEDMNELTSLIETYRGS